MSDIEGSTETILDGGTTLVDQSGTQLNTDTQVGPGSAGIEGDAIDIPAVGLYTAEDEARDRARLDVLRSKSGQDIYAEHKEKVDAFLASFSDDELPGAIIATSYATFVRVVKGNDPVAQSALGAASNTVLDGLNDLVERAIKANILAAMQAGNVTVVGSDGQEITGAEASRIINEGFGGLTADGAQVDPGYRTVTEDQLLAALNSEFGRPQAAVAQDEGLHISDGQARAL